MIYLGGKRDVAQYIIAIAAALTVRDIFTNDIDITQVSLKAQYYKISLIYFCGERSAMGSYYRYHSPTFFQSILSPLTHKSGNMFFEHNQYL